MPAGGGGPSFSFFIFLSGGLRKSATSWIAVDFVKYHLPLVLTNDLFRQYQSAVFENLLVFVFHPKHLSLCSRHQVGCHSPPSWQDPELPSHLPAPGSQCLLHVGLLSKRGSR